MPPGMTLLLKVLLLFCVASSIAWWMAPLSTLEAIGLSLLLSGAWWWLLRDSLKEQVRPLREGNVIYFDEFKRRKSTPEPPPEQPRLVQVFDSPLLHEADLAAAFLEHNGIPTHVLNRHNASILIHPLGEMTVRVMVHEADAALASQLLERRRNSPEGSFTA